jgi:hypothetical protein
VPQSTLFTRSAAELFLVKFTLVKFLPSSMVFSRRVSAVWAAMLSSSWWSTKTTMVSSGEVTLGTLPALQWVEITAFGMSEMRSFAMASPVISSEVVSLRYSHGALGREQLRVLATGLDLGLHIMDIWFERCEADGGRFGRSKSKLQGCSTTFTQRLVVNGKHVKEGQETKLSFRSYRELWETRVV